MPPINSKKELRQLMRAKRAELFAENPSASNLLCDRFLAEIKISGNVTIAGYIAQDHEIDPALLMKALNKLGYPLALPSMPGDKDAPLIFRSYKPGQALISGRLGILEPSSAISAVEPDILLVPLLAFDRNGHRLGRGGGHYDRTLGYLRKIRKITAIGLAFDGQRIERIPADSHDAKLDKIITPTELILS